MVVGDKVRVINDRMCYSTYRAFARKYLKRKLYLKWLALYKTLTRVVGTDGDEGIIVAIHPHSRYMTEDLCIVDAPNNIFIIGIEGLEVIS